MIRGALLAALLLALPARAADGPALFASRCAACHAAEPGAAPGAGPNLAGVPGRRVGGDPGFDYSPVLRAAREAGDVWDAARLDRYLADPEDEYPGNWMGANALRAAADRAAVIDYLRR